ncbi:hypothetical protein CYMTET_30305 [Cymbomonas tetramitiformis]|uniref:Uncharacterized protein n=1 Tax=Cymbomonas tetramitiformis TaxID=36881 RepID=A0AAE0FJ45_9CHLO|nr:hypothetical protein CYMTET_30305 [Cymbomonas tetramitiformis]
MLRASNTAPSPAGQARQTTAALSGKSKQGFGSNVVLARTVYATIAVVWIGVALLRGHGAQPSTGDSPPREDSAEENHSDSKRRHLEGRYHKGARDPPRVPQAVTSAAGQAAAARRPSHCAKETPFATHRPPATFAPPSPLPPAPPTFTAQLNANFSTSFLDGGLGVASMHAWKKFQKFASKKTTDLIDEELQEARQALVPPPSPRVKPPPKIKPVPPPKNKRRTRAAIEKHQALVQASLQRQQLKMAKLGGLVRAEEQRIEQQRAVLRKQMRRDATEHRTTFGLYEVVRALEIELSNNGPRSPSRPSSEAHGNTAATSDEEMMNATLMIEAAFENTVEVTDSPKESVLAQDAERVRSVTMRDWEPVENENQVLDLLLGSASSRRNTTTEQELRWAAARRRMRYKLRQARNRNAVRALVRGAMSKVLHSQVSLASAVVASAWSWHDLQKQNIIRGRLVRSGFYDKSGSLLTSMDQKYIHPQTKPTVFGRKRKADSCIIAPLHHYIAASPHRCVAFKTSTITPAVHHVARP